LAQAPKARVAVIRRRRHDDDLAVDVLDVVGYRGSCDCPWRGPQRSSYSEARRDLAAHRRETHDPER
jgi:hypothetical protein